jgi:hypothetical protein
MKCRSSSAETDRSPFAPYFQKDARNSRREQFFEKTPRFVGRANCQTVPGYSLSVQQRKASNAEIEMVALTSVAAKAKLAKGG